MSFGIFEILGIAFVVLKLAGVINWSWWWVCAPFSLFVVQSVFFLVGYTLLFWSERRK